MIILVLFDVLLFSIIAIVLYQISIILGILDHDLTAALCHRWLCSRQIIPISLSLLDVFTIISFLVVINIFHQYYPY